MIEGWAAMTTYMQHAKWSGGATNALCRPCSRNLRVQRGGSETCRKSSATVSFQEDLLLLDWGCLL